MVLTTDEKIRFSQSYNLACEDIRSFRNQDLLSEEEYLKLALNRALKHYRNLTYGLIQLETGGQFKEENRK